MTLCSFKELLQENEENCGKHILVVSYRGIVNPTPLPCTLDPIDTYLGCLKYSQSKASFFFPGSVERKPLLLGWSFLPSPLQSLFYFREICQIQVTSPTCFSNYGNQESMTMGSAGNTILRESMVIDDQDKHEEISFEVCLGKLSLVKKTCLIRESNTRQALNVCFSFIFRFSCCKNNFCVSDRQVFYKYGLRHHLRIFHWIVSHSCQVTPIIYWIFSICKAAWP